jgi:hypothetical protein
MKPFLTPHATVLREQRVTPPAPTVPPLAGRSTVLLSVLLATTRQGPSGPGQRNR